MPEQETNPMNETNQNLPAVVRQPESASGPGWALARLSDEDFNLTMQMAVKGRERLQQVMKSMMRQDVHFGKIPGTDKPTLLKPGAEVLCQMFHLVPNPVSSVTYGDGVSGPHITVQSKCAVHLNDLDGPVVAFGEGAANSWEKKWRYRNSERVCPNCGKPAIIKGQQQYGGGWLCFKKKDGCGSKWPDGADDIEKQTVGQIDNPDPYELLNTITKIANKRATLDAVIRGTSTSDLFTQDMDEMKPSDHPPQEQKRPPDDGRSEQKFANAVQIKAINDEMVRLNMSKTHLRQTLEKDYGVGEPKYLSPDDADKVIARLQNVKPDNGKHQTEQDPPESEFDACAKDIAECSEDPTLHRISEIELKIHESTAISKDQKNDLFARLRKVHDSMNKMSEIPF
jgi:hypothetical protein